MSWLVAAFLACQGVLLSVVNNNVKDDYMDEIFHGPQAREYCRGAFTTWHPKITTFPGIYILGTMYGWARWAAQALLSPVSVDVACSTPFLRSLNVLLSASCLMVLIELVVIYHQQTSQLHPSDSNVTATTTTAPGAKQSAKRATASAASPLPVSPGIHALLLALYPLHWFFSFLYYTDVASLLFLLLAQLQAARRRYALAGLAGTVAVLCRQTNVVWVVFLLGEAALAEVGMDWAAPAGRQRLRAPRGPVPMAGAAGGDGNGAAEGSVSEVIVAAGKIWRRRAELAARLWPLLLPPAGFAAFLAANGGSVVLGDKEAHKAVRHGAQLLYFAGWTSLMLWPQLLGPAAAALSDAVRRRPAAVLAAAAAAAVAVAAAIAHVSTMVHPYMLADNRHYVFYLWRRLLGRAPAAKYWLAPVYAAAWAALLAALRRRMSAPWVAGFVACLAVQLLPAWLLELRYFTPGFILVALRLQPPGRLQTAALLLMYGTIDAATLYLFLYRPYEFADGSVARFIW